MKDFAVVPAVIGMVAFVGCQTAEIRIANVSSRDFTDVHVAGQPYGDISAGNTSSYKSVGMKARYVAMKVYVEGKYFSGQTLNFGSRKITYEIGIKDFDRRHLAIRIIRDAIKD